METVSISPKQARRLALASAGLFAPKLVGLPERAAGRGARARAGAHAVVRHFGYLQLDSVAVAGARSHAIVLGSRLAGFEASVGESLLVPGAPLFEYWGHEASWLPIELYPAFAFRREDYQLHPWWGDVLGAHRNLADELLRRIDNEGPLRSLDLEGETRGNGWGTWKLGQRVMEAMWSAGELAVRERRNFQRSFDLVERVIPAPVRALRLSTRTAYEQLLLKGLDGHGWATTGTLAATWRLRNKATEIKAALSRMTESGTILRCELNVSGRSIAGWIRPEALDLAARLEATRPRRDRGVLLSPFDPVLWDRARVKLLFRFEQRLEIYKPAQQRVYGYYCLPVLAGDRLVGRVDLKAERRNGTLRVLSCHQEDCPNAGDRVRAARAIEFATARFAGLVGLRLAA